MPSSPRTISPCTLAGTVQAIPAKAEAHRLLIAAALADSPTLLTGLPPQGLSEDIQVTIAVLQALGATLTPQVEGLQVTPFDTLSSQASVDCGESGSTLRFMLPVIASRLIAGNTVHVTGHGRLPQRPLTDLLKAMSDHGSHTSSPTLPFQVSGTLSPGTYTLPGNVSSQYITGLLLALPSLADDSSITLTAPLESASYITLTLAALQRFGITIHPTDNGWIVPGKQSYQSPGKVHVGGDWSNAALWLVAGALSGPITVQGLDMTSGQGDKAILEVLRQAGAKVEIQNDSVTVSPGPLRPLTIDLRDIPDLLPVLSVLAAGTRGTTVFTHGARLRLKESDRLSSVMNLLNHLESNAYLEGDTLFVTGTGTLTGGSVSVCHDHRLVMAGVLASVISTHPITLDDPQAVAKSYPGLWQDFHALGGN